MLVQDNFLPINVHDLVEFTLKPYDSWTGESKENTLLHVRNNPVSVDKYVNSCPKINSSVPMTHWHVV